MKILTIERAKWRRGGDTDDLCERFGDTQLRAPNGMMCCLGFDAIACGLSPDSLIGVADPKDIGRDTLWSHLDYVQTRLIERRSEDEDEHPSTWWTLQDAVGEAIRHNDAKDITDDERETLIRADLMALGWDDVVFV